MHYYVMMAEKGVATLVGYKERFSMNEYQSR